MKKILIFVTGMIAGMLFVIVLYFAYSFIPEIIRSFETPEAMKINRDSMRLANEERQRKMEELRYLAENITFDEKSVKVQQVIQSIHNNQALVYGKDKYGDYYGTLYLLEDNMHTLYDDKVINIPEGMVLRMIGTYRYITVNGSYKTVPKVEITIKK